MRVFWLLLALVYLTKHLIRQDSIAWTAFWAFMFGVWTSIILMDGQR